MVELSSPHECNPDKISFPRSYRNFEEEINNTYGMEVCAISTSHIENYEDIEREDEVFDIGAISTRIISSSSMRESSYQDSTILTDMPNPPSFTSGKRHTDITA